MYLFLLYVFVYIIPEADLRHARRNVLDGAADTARLINLVQRIGQFEERTPTNNINDGTEDKDAGDIKYEVMKLLQKNYDVARKFNIVDAGSNVQYLVNPEVIAAYRKLPEEHTEEYDDISDQANTQRSYARELENIEKLPIHEMVKSKRRNVQITVTSSKSDDSNSDSIDDSSNDAGDATRVDVNQKTKVEDQDTAKANIKDKNSKDTKDRHPKSAETFKLLKPIVEQMLSKYSVKVSEEKDVSVESDVKTVSIKEKQNIDKQNHNEANFNTKKRDESNENIAVLRKKNDELDIPKKKKDKERLSLNRQGKKKKKNHLHKKQSGEIIDSKNEGALTKESDSVSERNIVNPTITTENNKSEEAQGGLNEENKKEQTKEFKNKLNGKKHMKHKTINFGSKQKTKKRINKEINSKENEKKKTFINMEETVMNWEDYDDDNKADTQHSGKSDEDKSSKTNKNKEESEKHDKYVDRKKINTKRKGDDNFDDKYDNENKKDSSKNIKQDWSKAEDDNWNKKDKPKKGLEWKKDDGSKENDWNKKDNKNKKDDSWNKKIDDDWNKKNDNLNKKKDSWNKKDDNWDKKDINWNTKEETKLEKNNKYDKNVDTSFKKTQDTQKSDSGWYNVGVEKKQTSKSGWGNYDSFKNIKDKTSYNERDYSRQEKRIPQREINIPKYQSWDRPSARERPRDDYYERPRNNGGRQSPLRTSIPLVGKKAVYAD